MDCSLPGPPSPLSRSRWQCAVSVWTALLESVVPRMSSLRVRLGRRICRGRMAEDGRTARQPGFSRQEYWSGLPFPSPGDLPNPGIEPSSPAFQADTLTSEPPGKPIDAKEKESFSLKEDLNQEKNKHTPSNFFRKKLSYFKPSEGMIRCFLI